MKQLLFVFLGGGIGSALRYIVGKWVNTTDQLLPWSTFSVNIIGSLLIGLILGWSLKSNTVSQNTILLLATGFCGGFTTFSAFAYENVSLLKSGELVTALLYIFSSIVLGICAVFLGIWISNKM